MFRPGQRESAMHIGRHELLRHSCECRQKTIPASVHRIMPLQLAYSHALKWPLSLVRSWGAEVDFITSEVKGLGLLS